MQFLLDAGADVNARDSAGNTATGCLPLGRGERHNDVQQEESMIIARCYCLLVCLFVCLSVSDVRMQDADQLRGNDHDVTRAVVFVFDGCEA